MNTYKTYGLNTQNKITQQIKISTIPEIVFHMSNDPTERDLMGQQIGQQLIMMSHQYFTAVRTAYGMKNGIKVFGFAPYNGSCLFDAVAHQLWPTLNIGLASKVLRKRVVNFIKANSKRFRASIESRIKHEYELVNAGKNISSTALKMKVMTFMSNLSRPSYYGGYESLQAIKEIHQRNIFELNALGPPRFVDGFNRAYPQTICLYHFTMVAESDKWEVFTKSLVVHYPYESVVSIF